MRALLVLLVGLLLVSVASPAEAQRCVERQPDGGSPQVWWDDTYPSLNVRAGGTHWTVYVNCDP